MHSGLSSHYSQYFTKACQDTGQQQHELRSSDVWGSTFLGASKKQSTTAASAMEAEYQACGAVAQEGLSLIKVLEDLGPLSVSLCQGW
jgi:hypothetical protein